MTADSSQGLEAYLDVEERESKRIQTQNLRRLARRILSHKAALVGGMIAILIGTFAALLEPRLLGYAIDDAIVPRDASMLRRIGLLFLLATCVRVIAVIAQGYLFELLGQRVTLDLRGELYSHLQRLPTAVYDKNPAGRLLTRVTNDVASLSEMFSAGFVSMAGNALMVAGNLAWLLILDFRLGLIAGSCFPVLCVLGVYFSKRLQLAYRDARSKLSALNAFLAENLLGMKVVHLFNRQPLHLGRFERINQWYAEAQFGTVRVFALFQPSITIAAGASMALLIWYGGNQTLNGGMKLGVLVAYFSYVLSLFQPVREIADKWNIFLSGMASAERIFSILDWETEMPERGATQSARPIEGLRGHVVFENVWFAYDREHWVLKDFSLEIQPGQRIGVVGHTGAGKTTLISLLMRFYEPQRGRILLDGKDLREYDKRDLRATVGIVQQDVFLFSGSFRDNITFWSRDSGGVPAVRAALGSLGFGERWDSDQRLAYSGSNVSMGEKQVIAFARALASRPRIWILDEATANMDSETERLLQQSLGTASAGATSILIAHRLATIRSADRILVLHKGALVEQGTHSELVALDGLYARLYRFQRAQEDAEREQQRAAERATRDSGPAP